MMTANKVVVRAMLFSTISVLTLSACTSNNYERSAEEEIAQAERCQKLKDGISDLRGKLVRRTELRRRYELECMSLQASSGHLATRLFASPLASG